MEPSMLSIPVEILTRIFETCDGFSQVAALASACKHTHAVWVTNSPTIIWKVAKSQIRSFDDALMAVRATAIVLKAYQAATLPPAVTMDALSGNSKLPDLVELKEVLNMQYLVRCIEYMYFYSSLLNGGPEDNLFENVEHYSRYPATQRIFPEYCKSKIPGAKNAKVDSFRDGFYRAMYRLLLAGAVLARVYMAPLFRAREEGEKNRFFLRCRSGYWAEDMDDSEDTYPTEADIAYIRQSPAYNFDVSDWSEIGQWRNREYETCFGPFASWIIKDGKLREQNEPQDLNDTKPDWAENRADIGAVRELMLLLVAYDHFNYKFINGSYRRYDGGPYMQKQGNRTVSIVRFGIFQVEKITMPAAVDDLRFTYLFAQYHPALEGTEGEDIPYQFNVTNTMWLLKQKMRGSHISYNGENPGPPTMLELWHFALRHYLNLGFKSGTFWMPQMPSYLESVWWKEVGKGEIFTNPHWAAVQKYKPGVVSWDHENN